MRLCRAVMICSQDRPSSALAFGEAFVALIGWIAKPASVLRIPRVSSEVEGEALLASRQPSVVKYQSSTYSMFSIFFVAYWPGVCGISSSIGALTSKSRKMTFFPVTGCSSSSCVGCWFGGGSGRGFGGGSGASSMACSALFHDSRNLRAASSSEHWRRSMILCLAWLSVSSLHSGACSAISVEWYRRNGRRRCVVVGGQRRDNECVG